MRKLLVAGLAAGLVCTAVSAAELTPAETRWLSGAAPVIAHARESGLPLDIVVQPQPAPGIAPLALAFVQGRCKLVLSLRGNPEADAALEHIAPDLHDAALELMAAHELGHCRRYVDGAWYRLPAGFVAGDAHELPGDLRAAWLEMQASRREEGYGDLVGLAWTRQHHPQHYPRLQRWLAEERGRDRIPGSQHDTLSWVRLAQDPSALAGASVFDAAAPLWAAGLMLED